MRSALFKWAFITAFLSYNLAVADLSELSGPCPAIGGKFSIGAFAEALAARRLSDTRLQRISSEYKISRLLLSAGLIHLAERGFSAMLLNSVDSTNSRSLLFALSCLSDIHKRIPSIPIGIHNIRTLQNLKSVFDSTEHPRWVDEILWESALYLSLESPSESNALTGVLRDSGPFEALSRAMGYSVQNNFQETVSNLNRFFSLSGQYPEVFKPFIDKAHLLYARSAYALKKYDESIQHFKMIRTSSNESVHALSESSWAYMMSERYQEAIGVAIGVQSGAVRSTFTPEPLMVMAMALNEMCWFPEAMSAISSFRRNYRDSYNWLKAYNHGKDRVNLYQKAVAFVRASKKIDVPDRVASEWIRSAVFLSHQERLNLLFQENELVLELSTLGVREQARLVHALVGQIQSVRERMTSEKILLKPGQSYSKGILQEVASVREDLLRLRHLRAAAPVWRKMLASHQVRVPVLQKEMITAVNQEFSHLNNRMLNLLEEVAENNELIEVEVLNGASEDVIWQNAHPEFKRFVENQKQALIGPEGEKREKVWDWGKTQGALDGRGEIWEDELNSLRADLYNKCSGKEKFSASKGSRS